MRIKFISALLLFSTINSNGQALHNQKSGKQETKDDLENNFKVPPDAAKPWVWWHWMNGNITRAGITADLEAMKRVGIGGVQVFQVTNTIPEGPVAFMSPAWRELMHFAVTEAARLGLSFTILDCAGWSNSGGPWVKPEQSMQMLAWTDLQISGPQQYSDTLPQAEFEERLYTTGINPGYRIGKTPLKPVGSHFYRDIALLAFPSPADEPQIREQRHWLLDDNLFLNEKEQTILPGTVRHDKVINLTDSLLPDGCLHWSVPPGDWTILRLGYTPTGQFNHPAPEGGVGPECDKFSREALQALWNGYDQVIIRDAGRLAGQTLGSVLIDSWEVGNQQWSPEYASGFTKRRGYDPTPWLPVLSGRIVESPELSNRFLWDIRRTNADLIADNYFGEFTRLCHAGGLQSTAEAYGGPFDEIQASGTLDIPMGEFWAGNPDQPVSSELPWSNRLSASAAHGYGKPIVAAEAFTARPADAKWSNDPYSLKLRGDWAYCQGINRFVIHRYAHQPWLDVKPGMTMGPYGINFERTNTLWEQSRTWVGYMARCQYMLQQGRFYADVAYFPGDQAPTNTLKSSKPVLNGYDYDILSADLLMQLKIENGLLTLPEGMKYRVLVIGGDGRLRKNLVEKISELSQAGALITCPRPLASPSLIDYPAGDTRIEELARKLWDSNQIVTYDATALLLKAEVRPDFEAPLEYIHRVTAGSDIYFVANPTRKDINCSALFRVNNRNAEFWHPETGEIEKVTIAKEQSDGRTLIPLHLDPAGSLFVVFRESARSDQIVDITEQGRSILSDDTISITSPRLTLYDKGDHHGEARVWFPGNYIIHHANGHEQKVSVAKVPSPVRISGSWRIQFPQNLGAPDEITLDSLISLSDYPTAGVRYFSGTATYSKTFNLIPEYKTKGIRLVLDLGGVKNIAEVTLNGVNLGILWKPPFSVDFTAAARSGENHLEVNITNLWINRLIGDEQEPSDCTWGPGEHGIVLKEWPDWFLSGKPRPSSGRIAFTTFRFYEKDSPLVTSGLLGPVTVRAAVIKELK
jgi:hypothetical protein